MTSWRALSGGMLVVALVSGLAGGYIGRLTACTSYVTMPRLEMRPGAAPRYLGPALYCEVSVPEGWWQ